METIEDHGLAIALVFFFVLGLAYHGIELLRNRRAKGREPRVGLADIQFGDGVETKFDGE